MLPLTEQCYYPLPPHLLLLFLISSLQCTSLYWLHCKCCPYSSQSEGKPRGHAVERLIENERLENRILEKKMEEYSIQFNRLHLYLSHECLRIYFNLCYCSHVIKLTAQVWFWHAEYDIHSVVSCDFHEPLPPTKFWQCQKINFF